MTDSDDRLAAVLDTVAPSFDGERGDWARVLGEASRPSEGGRRSMAFTVAAAALVGLVAVLAWPDRGMPPDRVLDRALAAAGAGEVFHATFEARSPGRLLDLRSGRRRALGATRELWFHPERGLRTVLRVGGGTPGVRVQTADEVGATERRLYEAFTTSYRHALASGLAKVIDDGELDGRDVYWVQIYSQPVPATPDLSTPRMLELADVVAIDRQSFKPVYVRQTLDGEPFGTGVRILRTSSVPAEAVPVAASRLDDQGLGYGESLHRDLNPSGARRRLKTPALWAGGQVDGVPLGRIVELDFEEGRGRFENWAITHGLALAYGQMSASGHPNPREPYVWLRQSPRRVASMSVYVPPEGTALVGAGGAFLVKNGTHVSIEASSEELAIAAARALRPIGR
jgi:hypothetical protein